LQLILGVSPEHAALICWCLTVVAAAAQDEMHGFFRSAKVASFVSFLMFFTFLMAASILLHYRESRYWWQHIFSLCFWILMTLVLWLT